MKQLLTVVVPRIAMEWDKVAHYLEFSLFEIMIIRQQYSEDCETCCWHLLEKWISSDQGVAPVNWATLLSAIRHIKVLILACNEIKTELKL